MFDAFLSSIRFLILIFTCLFLKPDPCLAQKVCVKDIEVVGNNKTKEGIILRELNFSTGDSLSADPNLLGAVLERNKQHILNTSLFNTVSVTLLDFDPGRERTDILIEVEETWYIYPIPLIELADRNFNVWWTEMDRDLSRLNIGLNLYHFNMTGNADKARIKFQTGYTNKYEFEYNFPYYDQQRKLRSYFNVLYLNNKEIGYNTIDNKLLFYRDDDERQLERFRMDIGTIYRNEIYATHTLVMQWHWNRVSDLVQDSLNSNFLPGDAGRQRYIGFNYVFELDLRNIQPYPTSGKYFSIRFEKHGLGIWNEKNTWFFWPTFGWYHTISDRWSIDNYTRARLDLNPEKRAYTDYTALGYGDDFVRGYELYIIDGSHWVYNKSSLRFRLIDGSLDFKKLIPVKAMQNMPVKVYLTANADVGYVRDVYFEQTNPLANELLVGGGIGADFVLYFDKLLRFEYSFNHLGENGLFLKLRFTP